MIGKFLNKGEAGSLQRRLTKNAAGSFGLKIASLGLAFVTSVLLARLFGPEGYGLYAYAIAWLFLLQIPAGLGMREIFVREIATYQARSEWRLIRGLLHWANQIVLIVSIGIMLLAAGVFWLLEADSDSQKIFVFWLALLSLPLMALTLLRQGAMQGLHRVVVGQLPELLIQPALFIILLGCAYLLFGEDLSVTWAMSIRVLTFGVSFLVGTELLRKNLPQQVREVRPDYHTRPWLRSILPFIFISSMFVINNKTDALMLGAMKGTESVGLYVVASRGAELVTFILVAVNRALGPAIANLYAEGNISKLQAIVTKSSRIVFFTSLPIALGLIIFGHWFLLLFGSEFTNGYTALTLLTIGQLLNAGMGSVGYLLNMTGHERDTAIGIGASAMLNVILNAILIPKFGIEGAASATAISTIVWNSLLLVFVQKRLKIQPTALGRISS